jgi:hypothetical protein
MLIPLVILPNLKRIIAAKIAATPAIVCAIVLNV